MQIEIRPETLEFTDFYNSKLEHSDVVKIVKEQNRKHGRFGLAKIGDSLTEDMVIENYWETVRGYRDDIRKEGEFVNKVLNADDLAETIDRGFERAKSVFYKKDFKNPVVILTAGDDFGDARLLCRNSFGINLSHLFCIEPNVTKAKKHIESYSIHEGNHVFLYQNGFGHGLVDEERAKSIVFMEGLATFLELPEILETRDTHKTYNGDVENWESLMQECFRKGQNRKGFLERLVNQESFRKANSESSLIKHVSELGDFVDDNLYEEMLQRVFVKNNGPAYHIGYNMWKKIDDVYGMKRVKHVVNGGPDMLFRTYERLKS